MHLTDMKQGFDNIVTFPPIRTIIKRSGDPVPFDLEKIVQAAFKAMDAQGEGVMEDARYIARKVQSTFQRAALLMPRAVGSVPSAMEICPNVEQIQDAVERELMMEGFTKSARGFVIYREKQAEQRRAEEIVSPAVRNLVLESRKLLKGPLSEFTYYRTYSRWIEEEGRRETWIETVDRFMSYMRSKLGNKKLDEFSDYSVSYSDIRTAILNLEVMPSMRLLWAAGAACEATNVAAFNCAFVAPTRLEDFGEILYVLACGTGVGFSVESRNVQMLPVVEYQTGNKVPSDGVMYVTDSKEGWANAVVLGMKAWYEGSDIEFDYSQVRPEGARLKTMGGRSSGPKPLEDLMGFVRSKILANQGQRLSNIDVHDIICKIGDCIVAGGVRRSALISLSDLKDEGMRLAKSGHWYVENNQRQLANNSAVYLKRPTDEEFMREWLSLVESHAGERGIFNRGSLFSQMPDRRLEMWQELGYVVNGQVRVQVGTNPCGEITLLSKQFCNLTEVVCRVNDTYETLMRKVRIATVLGTYQSMLTDFPYLSSGWKENCDRERLLGVSLTGQWDCPAITQSDGQLLRELLECARNTNEEYASRFGIPPSMSITCGKPSGTVSLLVDSASGGHQRYAEYYIRRVRISSSDPLFRMLKDQGLPYHPENGQTHETANTFVLEFPVHSPKGPYVGEISALDQLDYWKKLKTHFTEHNPSVTISVKPSEWYEVGKWVLDNWDIVGGLSFLPLDQTVYKFAPHEACTKEKYEELLRKFEGVDYSKIMLYEREDETQGSREYACVAGVCEIQ